MTKITTVYNYFTTNLPTIFPSKTRIPNGYSLADNSIHFLKDGYGLKTEGHFPNTQQLNFIVQQYSFKIVLCREILRMESDFDPMDTAVKQIEEDTFTAREFFYDIDCNAIPDEVDRITLGPTDPIGFLIAGNNNFIFVETSILVSIREQYANC